MRYGFAWFSAASLLALTPLPAAAVSYSATVLAVNESESTGSALELSIDNKGTVAREDLYQPSSGGNAYTVRTRIQTIDVYGNVENSFDAPGGLQAGSVSYQMPIRNDAGQVLTVTNSSSGGTTYQELAILQPSGTKTVLAERVVIGTVDRPGIPTYAAIDTSRMAINANGDVAALLQTTDSKYQVVKFPAGGGAPVVVAEASTSAIFNIDGVDINNSGQVAFVGTESGSVNPSRTTTTGVYVGDGTAAPTRVVTGDSFQVLGRPSLNDNGDVAAAAIAFVGDQAGYVLQKAGESPATPTYLGGVSSGVATSLNLNNYGQVAYALGITAYIDGEQVSGPGDRFDGADGTVRGAPYYSTKVRPNVALNDLGQLVAGVLLEPDNPTTGQDSSAIVRFDPLGATPENPLMPYASTPDGQNSVAVNITNALGVLAPIFLDPVVATGFTYTQEAGLPGFASLIVPDALPLGDDSFLLEFNYGAGSYSGTLLAGETFDFTLYNALGISSFILSGIDVAEMVDPTDPFVVGVTFVAGGFSSTVSIDAITVDTDISSIPLPAGLWLMISALGMGALGASRRRASGPEAPAAV